MIRVQQPATCELVPSIRISVQKTCADNHSCHSAQQAAAILLLKGLPMNSDILRIQLWEMHAEASGHMAIAALMVIVAVYLLRPR